MSETHEKQDLPSAEIYRQWLREYLKILNGFVEFDSKVGKDEALRMLPFLRVAEHVFNFFLTQESTYHIPDQVPIAKKGTR